MANNEKWEVVKNAKKAPKGSPQGSKKKQKDFISTMPRISHAPPVRESETQFSAFIAKEQQEESLDQKPTTRPKTETSSTSRLPQPKTKKPDKTSKKSKPQTLDEAMKNVKLKEFKEVLELDQVKFPNNPAVWLMDIASYLNLKLDKVVEEDPVFHSKPCDFPLLFLPNDTMTFFEDFVNKEDEGELVKVLETCALQIIQEMSKGISTYGYRIAVQIISRNRPEVALQVVPKLIHLIRSNQNQHTKCLAIMWVAGQVGWKHLNTGVQVWRDVMLPLLNIKPIAFYVVEYLEKLFKLYENKAITQKRLEVNNFFILFDLIVDGHPANLSEQLQRKLTNLLPGVKLSVFQRLQPDQLKLLFASFLDRVRPENTVKLREELLGCLMVCLTKDKVGVCCTSWKQLYSKHLYQSSILLEHMQGNWESTAAMDPVRVNDLIDHFEDVNGKLSKKSANKTVVAKSTQACQHIRSKLETSQPASQKVAKQIFSVKGAILLLLLAFAVAIGREVYVVGWKNSLTRKMLEEYHLLCALECTWNRVSVALEWTWSTLERHVPVYYAKLREMLGPAVGEVSRLVQVAFWYLMEVTEPVRNWMYVQLGHVVIWVDAQLPWIWSNTWYAAGIVFGFIARCAVIAWAFITQYTYIAAEWLQSNVFYGSWSMDNIAKYLLDVVRVLQGYLESLSHSLTNIIYNIPASNKAG